MPALISANPFIIRPPDDFVQKHHNLRQNGKTIARAYANNQNVTDEILQQMGSQLWQTLDHELNIAAEFEQARAQAGNQILPIIIESNHAAIHQLPWETLHHPAHGFLGKENGFTLTRSRGSTSAAQVDPPQGPLRVLLFTALPDDLNAERSRINVEEEQAQVLEALTPLIGDGLVKLIMPNDGRFATLEALLQNEQPHLVFLGGHGKFVDPKIAQPQSPDAPPFSIFQFEDDDGSSDPVDETRIAAAFRGTNVGCVVLVACELGATSTGSVTTAASEELTYGLTWKLGEIGIPHVIGMRESVLDRAGTLFTRAFCDAIAQRERVDVAVQRARQAITTPLKDEITLKNDASGLAEQSLGQWCLPMLLAPAPERPLIDWDFEAQPAKESQLNQTLQSITLPPRFVGRRSELRRVQSDLRRGKRTQLLLTGPGGQGKTALAGKLAKDLARDGYEVLAWSARPENLWQDFELEMELLLHPEYIERYNHIKSQREGIDDRAQYLLRYLMQKFNNRVVLFFDNLESLQDPQTQALSGNPDQRDDGDLAATILAWINAAQMQTANGLILLLTSRWRLPDWPATDEMRLDRADYGDFLQMALQLAEQDKLPTSFLHQRPRLRQIYQALHGNGRGLTFFASALESFESSAEEEDFLQSLARAEEETQIDLALELLIAHLPADARELLVRMAAYLAPVPFEGVRKLSLDLPTRDLLERLLTVSLIEATEDREWQSVDYELSPLLRDWLAKNDPRPPTLEEQQDAADYQLYLYRNERYTLPQAMTVHQALGVAKQVATGDRFALDYIVGPLNRAGLYQTLLDDWLPAICTSSDRQIEAEALGQTGKQYLHIGGYETALSFLQQSLAIQQEIGDKSGEGTTLNNISQIFKARGDYETALSFLQQSLAIQQEIGDKSGEGTTLNNISQIFKARGDYETALSFLQQSLAIQKEIGDVSGLCATLFNMGHIHWQNDEQQEAVGAWVTVYRLASQMGLAQALDALAGLADQLGLEGGLEGWAALADRAEGSKDEQ